MLPKIKYIAAYQSQPVAAITHYAHFRILVTARPGRRKEFIWQLL